MGTSVRHLVRRLVRAPFFSILTILTLAIGIGANTAIFSVVHAILLKPLPYEQPERLVGVWHTAPGFGIAKLNQAPATYFTYREEGQTFEDIGLWTNGSVVVTERGEPERIRAAYVTDGLLPVLRIQPLAGRRFTAKDDSDGAPRTVMVTYGYWQRKFGGSQSAIGQQLMIDGRPHEVIGVLPQAFRLMESTAEVVVPFQFNRAEVFIGNFSYRGIARLKPGVTVAQANADVRRMIPMLIEKFPVPKGFSKEMFNDVKLGPDVHPLADDLVGDVRRVLWVVFGMVGLVLLIACANVANLFLVRAEGRQQEMAVRTALGAGRSRMARELLGESITLSVAAGLVALLLAWAGIRTLVAIAPDGLPRLHEIGVSTPVVLFTFAVSILTGLAFGLIPLARFRSDRVASSLKEGGRGSSDGRERHRARSVLVVAEVALALVLLVGSGLMIRTFQAIRNINPGFTRPDEVLTVRISIPEKLIPDNQQVVSTYQQIAERVGQIPGVRSVGVTSSVTMDGNDSNNPVFVEGSNDPAGKLPPIRRFKWLGANYIETMGNKLVAGRTLTWEDGRKATTAALVSENFARKYWKTPGAALGKRIRTSATDVWHEVVGVVGDDYDDGVTQPPTVTTYWPMRLTNFFGMGEFVGRSMSLAIRSDRLSSPTFLKEIQKAVWSVNASLPVSSVRTLEGIQAESMAQTSFALVMLGIAAIVALLLGIVGIYGVIACIAAQRTREIGIRVALGAQSTSVVGMFVRYALVLTSIGLVLGIAAAAAATRLMKSLLFGVAAVDPLTYTLVAAILVLIALAASYLPARRASRVDPVIALRAEA